MTAEWNGVPASYLGVLTNAGILKADLFLNLQVAWTVQTGLSQTGNGKAALMNPKTGDIIFFDWEGDGTTDHVGIVEKCENGTVYTVEGNSGDACKQRQYTVGSSNIYGYGIPAY